MATTNNVDAKETGTVREHSLPAGATFSEAARERISLLAKIGLAGTLLFLGAIALLPFFRSDLSPIHDAISDYAIGPNGYVQTIAFFVSGIGILCLAFALRLTLKGLPGGVAGPIFMALFGLENIASGIFPTDAPGQPETLHGTIHQLIGILGFILMTVGIFILARGFKRVSSLFSLYPVSCIVGGLAVVMFFATGAGQSEGWFGLAQRGLVGTLLAWLLAVAACLVRATRARR